MRYCTSCGSPLQYDDANFCSQCGQPVKRYAEPVPEMPAPQPPVQPAPQPMQTIGKRPDPQDTYTIYEKFSPEFKLFSPTAITHCLSCNTFTITDRSVIYGGYEYMFADLTVIAPSRRNFEIYEDGMPLFRKSRHSEDLNYVCELSTMLGNREILMKFPKDQLCRFYKAAIHANTIIPIKTNADKLLCCYMMSRYLIHSETEIQYQVFNGDFPQAETSRFKYVKVVKDIAQSKVDALTGSKLRTVQDYLETAEMFDRFLAEHEMLAEEYQREFNIEQIIAIMDEAGNDDMEAALKREKQILERLKMKEAMQRAVNNINEQHRQESGYYDSYDDGYADSGSSSGGTLVAAAAVIDAGIERRKQTKLLKEQNEILRQQQRDAQRRADDARWRASCASRARRDAVIKENQERMRKGLSPLPLPPVEW